MSAFDEGIAVVVPQWDDRDQKIQPLLGNLSYLKHFKTELEKPKDESLAFTNQIPQQKPMNLWRIHVNFFDIHVPMWEPKKTA